MTTTRRTLFVTGTDTGVGKSTVACAMLRGARAAGLTAVGYKPVASGCEDTPAGLRNDDALALQAASSGEWPYEAINPYAFAAPIAPHIAAADAGVTVDPDRLDAGYRALRAAADLVVIEGAGGWAVPLGVDQDFAGWVAGWRWPVVLVVAMRLGCINHALLSAEAIARRTTLAGWIANCLPPGQPRVDDNIACLQNTLDAPLLARVQAAPAAGFSLDPSTWGLPR